MAEKLSIKKDDFVMVIAGKDKGKTGKILKVFPEEKRVIVEKINLIKRHTRPGPKTSQGGIVEREGKLHLSKVMIMCSKCNSPARVGKKILEEKKKVRICKKCGEILDLS